jgi:hypothetical protein
VEAVDAGADDGSASACERGREFVGQRRLAGGVWAVDRDAQHPIRACVQQQVCERAQDAVAGWLQGRIVHHAT